MNPGLTISEWRVRVQTDTSRWSTECHTEEEAQRLARTESEDFPGMEVTVTVESREVTPWRKVERVAIADERGELWRWELFPRLKELLLRVNSGG